MILGPALASFAASAASAVIGPSPAGDVRPVRGIAPAAGIGPAEGGTPQRPLDAVPPAPSRPLPRGSLLDLKV